MSMKEFIKIDEAFISDEYGLKTIISPSAIVNKKEIKEIVADWYVYEDKFALDYEEESFPCIYFKINKKRKYIELFEDTMQRDKRFEEILRELEE